MRIETPGPVRKPLPLTPLVDVVFLLLMFFMLSSTFTKFGNMDLDRSAVSAAGGEISQLPSGKAPGVIIQVSLGPQLRINGVSIAVEAAAAELDSYYTKGVRSGAIVLMPSAKVQDLVTVLEQVRGSKLRSLSVVR